MKSVKLALAVIVVFGLLGGSALACSIHIYTPPIDGAYFPRIAGNWVTWGSSSGVVKYDRSTYTGVTVNSASGKMYPQINENGDWVWIYRENNAVSKDHYWEATNLTGTVRGIDWINLDPDGNTAAYTAYYNPGSLRYDVLYTVNNGAPVNVSSSIPDIWCDPPGAYCPVKRNRLPDTDSSHVVWCEDTWSHIYMHDISAGTTTRIGDGYSASQTGYNQGPRVDGDYVVWQYQEDGDTSYDVALYQISTGATSYLWDGSATGNAALNPKVHNGRVVWEAGPFLGSQIYLYDCSSATTVQVTTGGDNRMPQINGNFITWVDLSPGPAGYDVYVYDIAAGTTTLITDASWTWDGSGHPYYGPPTVYDDNGDWVVSFVYQEPVNYLWGVAIAEQIPEPSTLCLLGAALAVAAGIIRKRLH